MLLDQGITHSRISISRSMVIGDASRASSRNVAKPIRYSQSSRDSGYASHIGSPIATFIRRCISPRRLVILMVPTSRSIPCIHCSSLFISEGGQVRVVILADVGLPVVVVWCVVWIKDVLPHLVNLAGVVSITRSVGPWLVDHLDLTYLANQVFGVQLHNTLRYIYPEGFQGNLQFPQGFRCQRDEYLRPHTLGCYLRGFECELDSGVVLPILVLYRRPVSYTHLTLP